MIAFEMIGSKYLARSWQNWEYMEFINESVQ